MNTRNFSATVAVLQLFLLGLWEAVGAIYFGWSPLAIVLVWGVGIWTLNIGTASVLNTFIKLTTPRTVVVNNAPDATEITEEDDLG